MKNQSKLTIGTFSFFIIYFFIISSGGVYGQHGHEKTLPDSSFGKGGTRAVFVKKGRQLTLYRDANNIRRLMATSVTINLKKDSMITKANMYYDNTGKKDYFSAITTDGDHKPVREVKADFSNDKIIAGSAWQLKAGLKVNYKFDISSARYTETNNPVELAPYKPVLQLGNSRAKQESRLKFVYALQGKEHYTATEKSNRYTGGTDKTEAYSSYDGYYDEEYDVEHKKAYDKNGVLRHEIYREYYDDGCVWEEETYYDCYGEEQYYAEEWYDDYDGYSYELYEAYYKNGKRVAAHNYDDYYYGHEYLDPRTEEWVYEWTPGMNAPEDFQPDLSDCPDAYTFWDHHFTGGISFIREDDGADGFFMYGLQATYTKNFNPRIGVTVDLGMNFHKENDTKISKLIALIGATYWITKLDYSDQFIFSAHGLAGISNIRYNYNSPIGNYKSSTTLFTIGAGLEADYFFNENIGGGLRASVLPTFGKGNTSINVRASLNFVYRMGKSHRQAVALN